MPIGFVSRWQRVVDCIGSSCRSTIQTLILSSGAPTTIRTPGATSLTSGNIRYCTNNPILIENLDVSPVTSGGYYILAVFNSDRTPGNFSFIPQAGNDVILGSSIISAPGNPGSVVECTPPFTVATYPDAASITGLTITGNGITNSSTGVFSPSVAGIGSHTITISGSPYGCAQRIGTYTINVTPCPYQQRQKNKRGTELPGFNSRTGSLSHSGSIGDSL